MCMNASWQLGADTSESMSQLAGDTRTLSVAPTTSRSTVGKRFDRAARHTEAGEVW